MKSAEGNNNRGGGVVAAQTWRPCVARYAQTRSRSPLNVSRSVASDRKSSDTPTVAEGAPGVHGDQEGGEQGWDETGAGFAHSVHLRWYLLSA